MDQQFWLKLAIKLFETFWTSLTSVIWWRSFVPYTVHILTKLEQLNRSERRFKEKVIERMDRFGPRSNVHEASDVKSMPIIVKFANQSSRHLFHVKYFAFTISDALKLSHIGIGSDERNFINENLCKLNLDLLRRAKKLKKNGKIAAAYS